ncbi:lipoate--protein ligase family protein [Thermococcus sp.]
MHLRVLTFEHPDPHFNLAFEESLARVRAKDLIPDTLRIWVNDKAIVLGYFRDPEEDVNLSKAEKEGFPIIRRFTGGGTVYHDKGCINYSIVLKRDVKFPISYLYGTLLKGTLDALKKLGIEAELRNTSDIVFGGKKISGTAGSIKWGVLFLHGSILINANLKKLKSLLRIPQNIKPSIDPVKYKVANLTEFIDVEYNDIVSTLIHGYSKVLSLRYHFEEPTKKEIEITRMLYKEKYSRRDWNMEKLLKTKTKLEEEINEILS